MTRSARWALVLCVTCACGGGSGGDDDAPADAGATPDGGGAAATAVFQPVAPGAGASWGTIPYPSDLFLDSDGYLTILDPPVGPNADDSLVGMLMEALHDLDGAGVWSRGYVPIAGAELDPATLAGNVAIVNLDDGLAPVPCELRWRADLGMIVATPTWGNILLPSTTYGLYVLDGVRTVGGVPVARDQTFVAVADLATTPGDPALAAAQTSVRPLLEALDAATRDRVVVATVFETEDVVGQMKALRDAVAETPPAVTVDKVLSTPEELDGVFGAQAPDAPPGFAHGDSPFRAQPHSHVGAVLIGDVALTSFIHANPGVQGFIEFDTEGAPIAKGTHTARYHLVLPEAASYADLPIILYQAGLNRTRADMLTQADTLTRAGFAVLAIDVAYHGSRSSEPDVVNNLTGAATPDDIGDESGFFPIVNFFHLLPSGGVPAYHPAAMRDNLRQAAVEQSHLVAFIRAGDVGPINTALAGAGLPSDLAFRGGGTAIVTESFGAMISGMTLAVEPDLDAAVMTSIAAGFPFPAMLHSPSYAPSFAGVTTEPFDVHARTIWGDDVQGGEFEPIIMFWNMAIERGEPSAYGPLLFGPASVRGDAGPNLILTQSWSDEWVPNESQEHYAGVVGAPYVDLAAPQDAPQPLRYAELATATAPLSGNVGGGQRTISFTVWYPAAHAFLRKIADALVYEPGFPPFVERDTPLPIDLPVVQLHEMYSEFLAEFFAGAVPTLRDPYAD